MAKCKVTIINKLGLHARAAAKFVSIANQYPCQVRVGRSAENLCDGKNIMSVMMLAANNGTELYLNAEGEQATEALQALQDLIARRFDEEA
ncbi:HPr family phosphocarrier protein [Denitrificimonas sp. JX-1]|uniref:HPr family phosphocarrier protein n=1 Tax=Denitrificimonas halotolerans TaxID=3098930 RepID=A0ABU5GN47_9GAMM|nr:HPr family phosphocarrier protein [Denitrificimonas sp. JX-1]MDY7218264.1 HPr family phosphocarrier protein [Denitrificimonas sp. JX-1]